MDSKIYSVSAREILDSRGNPTIEVTAVLGSGYRGVAAVPSGASVGKYEAVELRDHDEARYGGRGVLKAVDTVKKLIAPKIKDMDGLNQGALDKAMVDLDGTPNKAVLGANSILGVSLAVAVAAANHVRMPLYKYLNVMAGNGKPSPMTRIPTPTFNVINGGKHGGGNLDFQEYHIVPATNKSFSDALRMGVELYHDVKQLLINRGAVHATGDEGGFAPSLSTNMDPLELLTEAIRTSKYRFGGDVFFGLDVAASSFKTDRGYQIKDRPVAYRTPEFIDYIKGLHKIYRLLILEDPLGEDDWDGWIQMSKDLGGEVLLVGDDLLTTNPERLQHAIQKKACSAILLKLNQIGSLSEFLAVVALAKKNDIKCIVSHRSGETTDTFVSDLAVAVQSDYVKFGAPARGERVVKYNRLLAIEAELFGKP
ncbi:phosphopyruvate hydratase [Candidatus Gottesmanbacteria bacterium RIFCSPLOWO2_01_FULL_46_9]|uniref:Enolase n=1 Tax=Candidatus Gottesmanbacteria bacterium RIFCSPLOWO2_01_FULL_46_9 TaxID=1798394 RepID=A0A1F6AZJ0_9BACT|nr:MAG: phosphopyruvate hydratase [Candidatus Gottesmanbacteria bacterium RIFCSPLOWO2_01_FULL_46_9]